MDIFDREWCNLYVWTPAGGSAIYHVRRDRAYWGRCFEVLAEFWWSHVVPARQAHGQGRSDELEDLRCPFLLRPAVRLAGAAAYIDSSVGGCRRRLMLCGSPAPQAEQAARAYEGADELEQAHGAGGARDLLQARGHRLAGCTLRAPGWPPPLN
jgi:hypothetical protein